MGIALHLRDIGSPIGVIGVDPAGSLYNGGPRHPFDVEGAGEHGDEWPPILDTDVLAELMVVTDEETSTAMVDLARRGFLVGPSSGMVYAAARRRVSDRGAVLCIFPDSLRNYLHLTVEGWHT